MQAPPGPLREPRVHRVRCRTEKTLMMLQAVMISRVVPTRVGGILSVAGCRTVRLSLVIHCRTTIMNKTLATFIVAAATALPAFAETSIGLSIGIQQPGVYGRIDIGNAPPPPVIYAQPVVIVRQRVQVEQAPMYLYVPPGHQKNWRRYCKRYEACGQPVYFVQERWVEERYEERHGNQGNHGNKKNKGKHGRRDD